MMPPTSSTRDSLAAWAVHLFTSAGVVITLVALDALHRRQWDEALLWLLLALVVDGVDGTLARAARVKERVPRIDGEALDLIVDYLNYVLVPTLLMWRAGLLPVGYELPLAAAILLSSLYVFTRRDMKTEDGYFRGFPALWNVVALYFLVTSPPGWASGAVVLALVALTFAPILFVHPFRSRGHRPVALPVSAVWAASTAALLIPWTEGPLREICLYVSLAGAAVLVALGLHRTLRGEQAATLR